MHQRRAELHKEIRRKQLQQLFKTKREQLIFQPKLEQIAQTFPINDLAHSLDLSIDGIYSSLKRKDFNKIFVLLDGMYENLVERTNEGSIFLMMLADKFGKLISDSIRNEQKMQEVYEWIKVPNDVQEQMIQKVFNILKCMNYREIQLNQFSIILSAFWLIFSQTRINIYLEQSNYLLSLVLEIIGKMLQGQNQLLIGCLIKVELGDQLCNIIKKKSDSFSENQQVQLSCIIDLYLRVEIQNRQATQKSLQIINIGKQCSEKQVFLAFLLSLLHKGCERAYLTASSSIILIFSKHEYLCQSVQIMCIHDICGLLTINKRDIQVKSIQILDDILYENQKAREVVFQKMYLPDLLLKLLQRQLKYPDESSNKIAQRCSLMIGDMCLSKNTKLRKQYQFHPIWQLAYQNISNNSPLLPLVNCFEYYFDIIPRDLAIRVLQSYLAAIGQLQFQYLPKGQYQAIKRTIIRVYIQAKDFWPNGYVEALFGMLTQNNLRFLLQEWLGVQQVESM